MSDEQGQGRVYTSVEHYNRLLGFLQTDRDWTFSDKMMVHQALTDYEMEVKRAADRIDTLTADLAAMTADRDRLREVVESAHTVAHAAPELNPSNYTHDQACELNTAMCEVFNILDTAREQQAGAKGGE